MKQRFPHAVSPAVLVGMAVVLSVGAAAQASSGAPVFCARQGVFSSGESDRDSVARWLANFTNAAKRLHAQAAAAPAPPSPSHAFDLARRWLLPPGDNVTLPPPAVMASHLIDLPPPAR